jgi:heme exporter protein A
VVNGAHVLARGFNHTGGGSSTEPRPALTPAIIKADPAVLQAEQVAAFRGERLVLRDIDFVLPGGGALLLLGPNGAGKSTLLRVLAGLLRPAAGQVCWNGQDALADPVAHAARLVYVGHQDAVKPGLTAAENLRFAASVGGGDVAAGLAAFGLAALAELPARLLSAGQKRRLALARLAVSAAPIWLLDEPTLGLDAAAVARFAALLAAQRRRGGIVVAATHLPLPLPDAAELRLG